MSPNLAPVILVYVAGVQSSYNFWTGVDPPLTFCKTLLSKREISYVENAGQSNADMVRDFDDRRADRLCWRSYL